MRELDDIFHSLCTKMSNKELCPTDICMNSGQITFSTVTCQIVALLVGVYKVVVEARRAGCFVVTGAVCAFDQAALRGDQTENEKAEDVAVAALLSQTNPPAAVVADS